MVTQIEYSGKSGRREVGFRPEPVLILGFGKPGDAARYRRIVRLAGGHKAEQGPRGLRRCAGGRLIAVIVQLVTGAVLAPSPVGILDAGQPVGGFANAIVIMLDTSGVKRAQHRPGAVDVVHAPAAVPAAVLELGVAQIVNRPA